MIPMVDLKRQYRTIKAEIDAAVGDVLTGAQFILGPNVTALEEEVAAYHGVPCAIGVASGTDALLLALNACGVGEGDEVITTPFTFIATAEVASLLKAKPVFIDIRPDTFNMDPALVEAKITKKTKAIVPVHLFGHPADMDPLLELAARYNLKIIEDCAQAFGAVYKGRKIGTMGDCGAFSFFPSKNLAGYGDGGMIITKDEQLAATIRILRNHGSEKRYYHKMIGYNSRLDEIQAAIIRVKLKRIDAYNEGRRANARAYCAAIKAADVVLPVEAEGCRHVYHQFTLKVKNRDRLQQVLQEKGIASAVYYPVPLHRQEAFGGMSDIVLPHAEACAAQVLSLPMFPELTAEEILMISDAINHA
ncbi:MAG: DegT/DnrJ/EryC1/StrS family aminotransferase [Smithellaceae bacterium]|nr:DegT/DnrJ/EryC1/StrS family aminotransferase [Smithellaceae bacterium]